MQFPRSPLRKEPQWRNLYVPRVAHFQRNSGQRPPARRAPWLQNQAAPCAFHCGHTRNPAWEIETRPLPKRKKAIRIENPVAGCGFTTRNRARRFVAQGRAERVQPGVSIRFIQSDHRHRSAKKSVDATRYWYERAAHTGMARLAELANLPMIAPGVLLGLGRRKGAGKHTFLATQGSYAGQARHTSGKRIIAPLTAVAHS